MGSVWSPNHQGSLEYRPTLARSTRATVQCLIVAGCSSYYDRRARAAIVRAYRHALARLGEPVLRLMLLGLERVRVEVEHLQVGGEDVH